MGINRISYILVILKILFHTHKYKGKKFKKYIDQAIKFTPASDIKNIVIINIYDECPSRLPVLAKGSFYPATKQNLAVIDIYLDQNLGHMLSYHKKQNILTTILDKKFIITSGKYFIIDTILHEIGHNVFNHSNRGKINNKSKQSETFANKYSNNIFCKMFPYRSYWYIIVNKIYRVIYTKRIEHDNKVGNIK